jgi:peptidoglycan/LPS O-acetylase OafA/YrhL
MSDSFLSSSEPLLRRNMPELDTIRGLAILGVVVYHSLYEGVDLSVFTPAQRFVLNCMAPGQFGVALFFVLSGFLITGLLLDSRNRPDYYRRFYIRRALRILPAYYAILALLAIAHLASGKFLLVSFLYCSNLAPLLNIPMFYPVLWSLSVEEHFYLAWPTVVHRISLKGLVAVAIAIVIASPCLRFLHFLHGLHAGSIWLGFDHFTWNAADGLACGAILAVAVRAETSKRIKLFYVALVLCALVGAVTVAGLPFGIVSRGRLAGATFLWTLCNFASLGLLMLFLLVGTSRRRQLVTPRVLLFLGNISYGLYLVHLLIFRGYDDVVRRYAASYVANLGSWQGLWVRFVVAGAISILVSWLSRRYFEGPILSLKDKYAR